MYFKLSTIAIALACAYQSHAAALNSPDTRSLEARAGTPKSCGDPRLAVPLFRAYSAGASDHFYTTNAQELQNAVINIGYTDEGTTGYVFSSQEPHTVPLFRLASASLSDHFYTTNAAERDSAVNNLGYVNEGVTGFVYTDNACGGAALFRLFSAGALDHFYTMSAAERDNASSNLGYGQEGVAAFILPF